MDNETREHAENLSAPEKGQQLVRGSIDAPPTKDSLKDLKRIGDEVRKANPDLHFSQISDTSKRTLEAAKALRLGHVTVDKRWQGRALAGLESKELTPEVEKEIADLIEHVDKMPPGESPSGIPGETTKKFLTKVEAALKDALSDAEEGTVPVIITSNSNIQGIKWAIESGKMEDASKYLGKGGYGADAREPGSMFIIDGAGKFKEWEPDKALPEGTKAVIFRHAETPFNADYEQKPGEPKPAVVKRSRHIEKGEDGRLRLVTEQYDEKVAGAAGT